MIYEKTIYDCFRRKLNNLIHKFLCLILTLLCFFGILNLVLGSGPPVPVLATDNNNVGDKIAQQGIKGYHSDTNYIFLFYNIFKLIINITTKILLRLMLNLFFNMLTLRNSHFNIFLQNINWICYNMVTARLEYIICTLVNYNICLEIPWNRSIRVLIVNKTHGCWLQLQFHYVSNQSVGGEQNWCFPCKSKSKRIILRNVFKTSVKRSYGQLSLV